MYPRLWDVSDRGVDVVNPCAVAVVSTWWMLREIEVAALTVRDVHVDREALLVTLCVSVSKADPGAKGAFRTHGC
eukprot:4614342-Amphidinium_carterae.1